MKRHNTIKVVLVTLLVFMLLSWILPAAYFSGSYADQGRVQMGLFDLFSYPTTAISYFGYIAIFILVVFLVSSFFEDSFFVEALTDFFFLSKELMYKIVFTISTANPKTRITNLAPQLEVIFKERVDMITLVLP